MTKLIPRLFDGHLRKPGQTGGDIGYSKGPSVCPHCGRKDVENGNVREVAHQRLVLSETTLWQCLTCDGEWESFNWASEVE